jgi:hypothetical protein
MTKFMLIRIGLMAEITDAGALRGAALKHFDTADITSDDHPETADWHASEEGQEERRQVVTEDKSALHALVDMTKVKELLDGVPGAKVAGRSSMVVELEGTATLATRDPVALTAITTQVAPRLSPRDVGSQEHSSTHSCTQKAAWGCPPICVELQLMRYGSMSDDP